MSRLFVPLKLNRDVSSDHWYMALTAIAAGRMLNPDFGNGCRPAMAGDAVFAQLQAVGDWWR
jgi:hypothetical protein